MKIQLLTHRQSKKLLVLLNLSQVPVLLLNLIPVGFIDEVRERGMENIIFSLEFREESAMIIYIH